MHRHTAEDHKWSGLAHLEVDGQALAPLVALEDAEACGWSVVAPWVGWLMRLLECAITHTCDRTDVHTMRLLE
jgi:hypothetical protein